MTWESDITIYNSAVNLLGSYCVARDGNTPDSQLLALRIAAQTALDAIVTPLSGTVKVPWHYPITNRN